MSAASVREFRSHGGYWWASLRAWLDPVLDKGGVANGTPHAMTRSRAQCLARRHDQQLLHVHHHADRRPAQVAGGSGSLHVRCGRRTTHSGRHIDADCGQVRAGMRTLRLRRSSCSGLACLHSAPPYSPGPDAGGITNWLAVKMLFDRVCHLPGSGVIPMRFKQIREVVKNTIMRTFFDGPYLEQYINTKMGSIAENLDLGSKLAKVWGPRPCLHAPRPRGGAPLLRVRPCRCWRPRRRTSSLQRHSTSS